MNRFGAGVFADQPVGPPVDLRPAKRPERTTLAGRHVTLVPLDADRHADALFPLANGGERDRVWTYLADGPYADPQAFKASIAAKAKSEDPLFFAVIDNASGGPVGYQTLMRIDAANRVIEIGNVLYTPTMQRTIGATEAQYLFAAYVVRRRSAIAATNGSATTSTRRRNARRGASASRSRACSAST